MNNEFSSALIDQSPLVIFILDVSSRKITHVNAAFKKLFDIDGLPSITELALGIDAEDNDYLQKVFRSLLTGDQHGKVEFRYTFANDEIKWLRAYPSLINVEGQNKLAATLLDITSEIDNYSLKDKYANKKNSVLNILAHDLAGPLSIANSLASSLKNRVEGPLYNQAESLANIIHQSYNIIRDLTNREFLEATEVQLVKDRIDIVQKLQEYYEEYQLTEQLTKKTFVFNASAPAIFIEVDESKFIQIINNLTTNALKFTHEGAFISMNVEEKENSVLFTFRDNGIGIPAELQSALFEKYTPARRKGLKGEPSTGLGMWVVKTIVEWHKGTIWCNSKENEGTTIFFELPKQ